MKVSLLTLLLLLPLTGWSQDNTESATRAFKKAESLRHQALLDSSNIHFEKAARLYQKSQDWDKYITSLYKLSLNAIEQGHQDKAIHYLENAYTSHQEHTPQDTLFEIKYYHQKGWIAEAQATYDRAIEWYERGLKLATRSAKHQQQAVKLITSIGDIYLAKGHYDQALTQFTNAKEQYHQHRLDAPQLLSSIYNSTGSLFKEKGAWKKAEEYYRRSLEIDKKTLPSPHPQIAKSNNNLATVYYYQSDYQHALDHMKNAVSVLSEFYGENHRLVAAGYNNLGVVYSMTGQLDEAANYLKKSLEIKEVVLGKDHPEVAIGYMNLGAIYFDLKQYDRAIENYQISKKINLDHFPEGHPELADVYANLGEAYAQKGAFEKALDYYHKDLNINLNLLDANHPFIGDTYTKIGEVYALTENYDRALNYYQRALGIFVKDYSEVGTLQNPPLEEVVYPELLLQTLELKADALSKSFDKNGDLNLLDQSLQTYLQAVQLIDKLQNSYNREGSKFLLREKTVSIYKKGIATAYKLHKLRGTSNYTEYAFYFAEKSRNQILLEQIQQLNAQDLAQIPDSLINHEDALRAKLTDFQQELSGLSQLPQKKNLQKRIAIQDSLFRIRKELENHIHRLETAFPKYYQLKYDPVITHASDVQQDLISPKQTVLSYYFGQEDLFVFIITKESFHLRKIATDSLLAQQITDYRTSIQETTSAISFAKSSYQLYRRLIEPISDLIKTRQLIIIPDGMLHYMPFESLISQTPTESEHTRFRTLPYLVNDYIISYAPSVGYLDLRHQLVPSEKQKQLVGFAPVFSNTTIAQNRTLYPDYKRPVSTLPLSKQEIQQLGKLYNEPTGLFSFLKSNREQADIFVEDQASEAAFKSLPLKKYRYIHLATHAFMLEEHPEKSGILFAAPHQQPEDGILHAAEIYNLRLDAQLVTLSACNTGVGSIAQGEGMMSLSRAFQYAGARNLLVSLWSVDDRSTEKLMVDFYKKIDTGETMTAALQKAKEKMIHRAQYAHPKYWAPLFLSANKKAMPQSMAYNFLSVGFNHRFHHRPHYHRPGQGLALQIVAWKSALQIHRT